ncbi:MAG TPA: hypothetical protein VE870_00210 [Bacteroidales bacterium]|nr:hypothetical protein [Bacteroidales bacterium]
MKKALSAVIFVFLSINAFTQVFNSGHILRPGQFTAGMNPVLNDRDGGFYLHGGYGLNKKVDFGMRYGILAGQDYFGADFEWALMQSRTWNVSLITGAHVRRVMGLDGGLVVSYAVAQSATIFAGVDVDLDFYDETEHYTWVPLGVEVYWRRNTSVILEADIPMSDWAWNIFGGGLAFYF